MAVEVTENGLSEGQIQAATPAESLQYAQLQEINAKEKADILKDTTFHSDPYELEDGTYQSITAQELEEQQLGPEKKLLVGGVEYNFSKPYDLGEGRIAVVAFVRSGGKIVARSYYRSNSQGVWRYLPSYIPGNNGSVAWYGKYTNENAITLPFEVQKALSELSNQQPLEVANKDYIFGGLSKRYVAGDSMKLTVNDASGQIQDSVAKANAEGVNKTSLLQSPTDVMRPPEAVTLAENKMPDFSTVIATWQMQTALYGQVVVEVFASKDKTLKYMMNRDILGRAWVAGIEDGSQIGTVGLRKQWYAGGELTTPAYEYHEQAGNYGNGNMTAGNTYEYVDMYQDYLSKIPLIAEYQESVQNRNKMKLAKETANGSSALAEHREMDKATKLSLERLRFIVSFLQAIGVTATNDHIDGINAIMANPDKADRAHLAELVVMTDNLMSTLPLEFDTAGSQARLVYHDEESGLTYRMDAALTTQNARQQVELLGKLVPSFKTAVSRGGASSAEASHFQVTPEQKGGWLSRKVKELARGIKNTYAVAGGALGVIFKKQPELRSKIREAERTSAPNLEELENELKQSKLNKEQRQKLLNAATVAGFIPGAGMGLIISEVVAQATRGMGVDPIPVRAMLGTVLVGIPMISEWLWSKLRTTNIPSEKLNEAKNKVADALQKFGNYLGYNKLFHRGAMVGAGLSPFMHGMVVDALDNDTAIGVPNNNVVLGAPDSNQADIPPLPEINNPLPPPPDTIDGQSPVQGPPQFPSWKYVEHDTPVGAHPVPGWVTSGDLPPAADVQPTTTAEDLVRELMQNAYTPKELQELAQYWIQQANAILAEQIQEGLKLSRQYSIQSMEVSEYIVEQPTLWDQIKHSLHQMPELAIPAEDMDAIVDGNKDFGKAIAELLGFDSEGVKAGSRAITIDSIASLEQMQDFAEQLQQTGPDQEPAVFILTTGQQARLTEFLMEAYQTPQADRTELQQFVAQYFNALKEVGGPDSQVLTTAELVADHEDKIWEIAEIVFEPKGGAQQDTPLSVAPEQLNQTENARSLIVDPAAGEQGMPLPNTPNAVGANITEGADQPNVPSTGDGTGNAGRGSNEDNGATDNQPGYNSIVRVGATALYNPETPLENGGIITAESGLDPNAHPENAETIVHESTAAVSSDVRIVDAVAFDGTAQATTFLNSLDEALSVLPQDEAVNIKEFIIDNQDLLYQLYDGALQKGPGASPVRTIIQELANNTATGVDLEANREYLTQLLAYMADHPDRLSDGNADGWFGLLGRIYATLSAESARNQLNFVGHNPDEIKSILGTLFAGQDSLPVAQEILDHPERIHPGLTRELVQQITSVDKNSMDTIVNLFLKK